MSSLCANNQIILKKIKRMNENIVLVVVSFVSQKVTIFMVFLFDEKQYLKYKKLHKTVNRFFSQQALS